VDDAARRCVRSFMTEAEHARRENGVSQRPKYTERFVAPAIEAVIADGGAPVRSLIGEKGDVPDLTRTADAPRFAAVCPGTGATIFDNALFGNQSPPDITQTAIDDNGQA
jgi:hypothetical protein